MVVLDGLPIGLHTVGLYSLLMVFRDRKEP